MSKGYELQVSELNLVSIPIFCMMLFMISQVSWADEVEYVRIPSGHLQSNLNDPSGQSMGVLMAAFEMRSRPVTQQEFDSFLWAQPQWNKKQISPLMATSDYLADHDGAAEEVMTHVSWFAARAYCHYEHARLPTWFEWEYVAAADTWQKDARTDAGRNQGILTALQERLHRKGYVGQHLPNSYGIYDMNSLIWEWVEDFAAMFPQPDARDSSSAASLALCGGSALAFHDRGQFALMMRVAALSSLRPDQSSSFVGFRCVRSLEGSR